MRTSILRQVSAVVLVLLMVCSSLGASADNPYQRALQHGRRYVHRPVYKKYQRPSHRRGLSLFRK